MFCLVPRPVAAGEAASRSRSFPHGGGQVFAAVAFEPVAGRSAANAERLALLTAAAARRGARYVVLPALALGAPPRGASPPPSAFEGRFFSELARAHGVRVVSSITEKAGQTDSFYVTTVL